MKKIEYKPFEFSGECLKEAFKCLKKGEAGNVAWLFILFAPFAFMLDIVLLPVHLYIWIRDRND